MTLTLRQALNLNAAWDTRVSTRLQWLIPMLVGVSVSRCGDHTRIYSLHLTPFVEIMLNRPVKGNLTELEREARSEAEASIAHLESKCAGDRKLLSIPDYTLYRLSRYVLKMTSHRA
jgi:hypothetical protein